MADTKIRVGYWKIRGLAHPIRTLLKYLGQEFVDEQFEQGDAPEYSREAWLKVKPTLDLDFPNLPFFEDGKVKLTQSQTIMRYIARAYGAGTGLYEGTPAELAEIDLMMDQVVDLRTNFTRCSYGGMPFASLHESVLPGFLASFEKVLAGKEGKEGRAYLAGDKLTLADFAMHEVLDGVQTMVAELSTTKGEDVLAAYPLLAAYKARFEALPAVAAYRGSAEYMSRPFNNKIGVWM